MSVKNEAPSKAHARRLGFASSGVVLVGILLSLAWFAFWLGRQGVSSSLGPALDLPVSAPRSAPGSAQGSAPAGAAAHPQAPPLARALEAIAPRPASAQGEHLDLAPQPSSPPGRLPKAACGGPHSMLLLVAAADADDYLYGLSDVIRIARLDFVEPSITVISLPRDLWVEIPAIQERSGYTHGKLNQAYFFGGPGMGYYDGPAGGPGLLALTLYHNFGLAVDHYLATNSRAAVQFVDALGGVDIELLQDVDGRTPQGAAGSGYFPAGRHHFDGQTALRFARVRLKYSDFQRQDNQSLLLLAVRARLLSPAVLPRLPALVQAFHDAVLTDLSLEQFGQAACLLGKVGEGNITLTQLPKGTYTVTKV
jgi:LCP family protein required for cell wall assembly